MITSRVVGCLILGLITLLPSSSVRGDDDLKSRFRRDYPAALAKLEARYNSMHGQADYLEFHHYTGKSAEELRLQLNFAFAPDAARLVVTSAKNELETKQGVTPKAYEFVRGVNSDYAFRLTRKAPTVDLVVNEILDDPTKGRLALMNNYGFEIQPAFHPGGSPLPVWIQRDRFLIDDVSEELSPEGLKSLVVKYTSQPSPWVNVPGQKIYGWFIVSPQGQRAL